MITLELSAIHFDIMDHTIHRAAHGLFCGGGREMDELVEAGMMRSAGFKAFVEEEYFRITDNGREALAKWKAAQPKPKKGRRRSREFNAWMQYTYSVSRISFSEFHKTVYPSYEH